jgi:hypothetical protein
MIETLVTLLIVVVVVGIIGLAIRWALDYFGAPEIAKKIVWGVFVLICLLVLIGLLGYGPLKGPWR